MATIVHKTINGYGPYAWKVTYIGNGKQDWEWLGKVGSGVPSKGPVTNDDTETRSGTTGGRINTDKLDGELQEFAEEFDDDDIEDVLDTMLFDSEHNHDAPRDILRAIQEATDNETLANNIDTLTQHTTSRPSLIEAAADKVEEELGCRPFEVQVTEPNNDFQDPMVSLKVDDTTLVDNPDINAELLNSSRATGTATTASAQETRFEMWGEAIGKQRVAEFKRSVTNPDALGFSLPADVPATGEEPGRTPVTEIPYIGEATAEDMHPTGDTLAVEDLSEMTEKQRGWVDLPGDGFESQEVRGAARTVPDIDGENTTDLLGSMSGMIDRRDRDDVFEWRSADNRVGILESVTDMVEDDYSASTVTNAEEVERESGKKNYYELTTDDGGKTAVREDYWGFVSDLAENDSVTVEADPDSVVRVNLPDGNEMLVAPIHPDGE